MSQELIYTNDWEEWLKEEFSHDGANKRFVITDSNVFEKVWHKSASADGQLLPAEGLIVIEAGEQFKTLDTARYIWDRLESGGATRGSVAYLLGGGVVTDVAGFACATFKRGIRFVNIPTTLLAMADAAIGGKTGVNYNGLKNEVGVFAPASKVVICTRFLTTLPEPELRSGFAEVVKMAIVTANDELYARLRSDDALHNEEIMTEAVRYAARQKVAIVDKDPYETKGVRRLLNFGHTAGHAYEEYAAAIGRPISHGEAVAHGMLKALQLSHERNGWPERRVQEYKEQILDRYFNPLPFGPEALPELERLMAHDKKNVRNGEIRWVLLPAAL